METDKVLLRFPDEVTITRTKRDLTAFCDLLNNTLATLKTKNLLFGDVDTALLQELTCYKTGLAESRLEQQAHAEAETVAPFQKAAILNAIEKQKQQLREIVTELSSDVTRLKLSKGLQLEPIQRAFYILAVDNTASFDCKQIEAENTRIITGEAAMQYIEDAKNLFKKICDFDRKTRLFSGNIVRGVCESNHYKPGVITCYDGKIELDFAALEFIDFDTNPAILESRANPGNYAILNTPKLC